MTWSKERQAQIAAANKEMRDAIIAGMGPNDWPEDVTEEGDNCYTVICKSCRHEFKGHKHRPLCRGCSELHP